MKCLLLYRAEEFSPNNVDKDRLLLQSVGQLLEDGGYDVFHLKEENLLAESLQAVDVVISMARRFSSLMLLEQSGKRVWNMPCGVRRALSRESTLELLTSAQVPVPAYWSYQPETDEMFVCNTQLQSLLPGWIKGMHPRGVRSGDVQWVTSALDADSSVIRMASEGYTDIVCMKHVSGFVVKAYCVDGKLLHWVMPQQSGYTKFGDEMHNDEPHAEWVDEAQLALLAAKIGDVMQLHFFGFDAIVSAPGEICIIDVNDAPSFSSCRETAAIKIYELIQ